MKIGCHAVLFTDRIAKETEEVLKEFEKTGCQGVEIGARFFGVEKSSYLKELLDQYHLQLSGLHVSALWTDLLDDPQKVAFKREFNTYTGTYKGVQITVTSTGIGAPSAAIAMEEMYESGMEVAVRMGTVMALQDDMLGKFVIPIAAMRREGTSSSYVDMTYPAVADIDLVNCMNQTVTDMGAEYRNGLNCTMDGFYSKMHDSRFSLEWGRDMTETFEELKKLKVTGIDMESSCMLTVGRLMGVRTCVVTMTTVLENLKETLQGQARTDAEDLLCRVALEGIYRFSCS